MLTYLTSFTHRLERTPSSWAEIGSSVLGAAASVVAATVVYQVITHALTPVSGLWWSLFGGVGAVAVWRVSDAFGKVSRTLSGRVPMVEVEHHPWHPGAVHRLRVACPDVSDLKALEVTLEADAVRPARDARGHGGRAVLDAPAPRKSVFRGRR